MAHVISDYLGDGSKFGVNITHIVESEPLGTAGSVKMAEKFIDNEPFLVFYGDVIMDVNLAKMMEFDKMHEAIATVAVHPNDHPYNSDLVECNKDGLIAKFLPKPHKGGVYCENLVSAALYILSPDIFKYIPKGKSDFGKDIFPRVIEKGDTIAAYKTTEYLKDMGSPCMLIQASKNWNINLGKSWMVGDSEWDFMAGKEVGCKTVYINESNEENEYADEVKSNLLDAVTFILG